MKTILVAQFKHETNAFSPGITDRKAYEARNALIGETQIRSRLGGAKIELTGLLDFFQDLCVISFLPLGGQFLGAPLSPDLRGSGFSLPAVGLV